MEILNILPNLSIGVVAIGAMIYQSRLFIQRLREKDVEAIEREDKYLKQIQTHYNAMRDLEREMRELLIKYKKHE